MTKVYIIISIYCDLETHNDIVRVCSTKEYADKICELLNNESHTKSYEVRDFIVD